MPDERICDAEMRDKIVNQKYTSNIKNLPFLFLEMKRTALLLCEGKSKEEIIELSIEQNIYQLDKEQRRRELPSKMLARLSTINDSLVNHIANGPDNEAKLIAFFAMMKLDRLLFEYMYEVYADKFSVGHTEITDGDYEEFIERKVQNSEKVAGWKTDNLIRIRNAIKNTLVSAGLAKRTGSNLEILPPLVDREFCQMFEYEDLPYLKAILLEV